MARGTHEYLDDARNADILVSVNGELVRRDEATVSVFDSGFVLGDGIWEGLRLHEGGIAFLDQHLERLYEGARAIDLDIGLDPDELVNRLFACLDANGMETGAHIRLMVTRGLKATPYQDPRVTVSPATVVIIPEYKAPDPEIKKRGIALFTVHVRRGELWTSTGDYCLGGITRANVIRLALEDGIPVHERNFSLTDVYGADEAFVTGTFAGLTPVREIDGRAIGHPLETPRGAGPGPLTQRLEALYDELVAREARRP